MMEVRVNNYYLPFTYLVSIDIVQQGELPHHVQIPPPVQPAVIPSPPRIYSVSSPIASGIVSTWYVHLRPIYLPY